MLASVLNQQIAADRNKMFNDHNEHMHACLGTHGVFKETKEVFFTIIIIILPYTYP